MATKIEYNGSVVATVEGGNTATLPVKDLTMESDIEVTVKDDTDKVKYLEDQYENVDLPT